MALSAVTVLRNAQNQNHSFGLKFLMSPCVLLGRCEKGVMSSVNVRNCIRFYQTAEELDATTLMNYCGEIIASHWVSDAACQGCQGESSRKPFPGVVKVTFTGQRGGLSTSVVMHRWLFYDLETRFIAIHSTAAHTHSFYQNVA